jgi:hypothetical protein
MDFEPLSKTIEECLVYELKKKDLKEGIKRFIL